MAYIGSGFQLENSSFAKFTVFRPNLMLLESEIVGFRVISNSAPQMKSLDAMCKRNQFPVIFSWITDLKFSFPHAAQFHYKLRSGFQLKISDFGFIKETGLHNCFQAKFENWKRNPKVFGNFKILPRKRKVSTMVIFSWITDLIWLPPTLKVTMKKIGFIWCFQAKIVGV